MPQDNILEEEMDYTPDIYTLVDDEGVEQAFEMLDSMEIDDERYFAMTPYFENPEDLVEENCDLIILKAELNEDGEELMATIDNEEEYQKIGQIFLERLMEDFDEDEDEDE